MAVRDVTRAERREHGWRKPDNAEGRGERNLIVTWATKLTLAPDLGDRVEALIDETHLTPGPALTVPDALPLAPLGTPRWFSLFEGTH